MIVVHPRRSQFIIDHLDALYASHYLKYKGVYSVTFSISLSPPRNVTRIFLPQFRNFDYLLYSKWSYLLSASFKMKLSFNVWEYVFLIPFQKLTRVHTQWYCKSHLHNILIFRFICNFILFWLIKCFITMIHKVCGRYKNAWVITSFSCHTE